ncbi:DNA-directed DNA polymerase [Synchytrium endobioticum]|uniref:DNA-directed DNA polymerase n=1 Tax=Synchytrium endobioticum TaxID=286115 RepID=A0A507DH92_9FUNG|nr:DNA-directed DNA polymerase [Synchytrium endobioticum]
MKSRVILIDNGTTTSIFKDKGIFRTLQLFSDPASITTVGGEEAICEVFGPVRIEIAGELVINIPRAVFAPNSRRNILAESDIRQNGYEIKTNRNGMVIFEDYNNGMDRLLIPRLKNGLYETSFNRWEVLSHLVDEDAVLPEEFNLWHRRLAHPAKSTMVHMIQHETLANTPFKHGNETIRGKPCEPGVSAKLTRDHVLSSYPKECDVLGRLDVDIIGPIDPPSLDYRYVLACNDYRTRYPAVAPLKSRNHAFGQLLHLLFKLQSTYPHNRTQYIRIDGAGEFRSKIFTDFMNALGITIEYSLPHEHEYNGIAEAYNRNLMKPHSFLKFQSPHEAFFNHKPQVKHLRTFGCRVEVPIPKTTRDKIGPQRKQAVYIGFTSSQIIRILDPVTGNTSMARFDDSVFNESEYPTIQSVPRYDLKMTDLHVYPVEWNSEEPPIKEAPNADQMESYIRRILEVRAIKSELESLIKRKVFIGPMELPTGKKRIGNRWLFVIKKMPHNNVARYKGRLVAQEFSQRSGYDFFDTNSPVIDPTSYRYVLALGRNLDFEIDSMDVVTAYLYGDIQEDIFMKVPEGIYIPPSIREPCVKVVKALYGLRQSGRAWFEKYAQSLIDQGYSYSKASPCIFFKTTKLGRVITTIYVDDSTIMGDSAAKNEAKQMLTSQIEMKDLGQVQGCIGLDIEQTNDGIFIRQTGYTDRILEKFNMNHSNPRHNPLECRGC